MSSGSPHTTFPLALFKNQIHISKTMDIFHCLITHFLDRSIGEEGRFKCVCAFLYCYTGLILLWNKFQHVWIFLNSSLCISLVFRRSGIYSKDHGSSSMALLHTCCILYWSRAKSNVHSFTSTAFSYIYWNLYLPTVISIKTLCFEWLGTLLLFPLETILSP